MGGNRFRLGAIGENRFRWDTPKETEMPASASVHHFDSPGGSVFNLGRDLDIVSWRAVARLVALAKAPAPRRAVKSDSDVMVRAACDGSKLTLLNQVWN